MARAKLVLRVNDFGFAEYGKNMVGIMNLEELHGQKTVQIMACKFDLPLIIRATNLAALK